MRGWRRCRGGWVPNRWARPGEKHQDFDGFLVLRRRAGRPEQGGLRVVITEVPNRRPGGSRERTWPRRAPGPTEDR